MALFNASGNQTTQVIVAKALTKQKKGKRG